MIKAANSRTLFASLAALILGSASGHAADWLTLPAKPGTSNGKKIVLVAGDEEYRSTTRDVHKLLDEIKAEGGVDGLVLDLLLLDRENPRSLAWVLDTLRSRLKKLEQGDPAFALDLCANLPDPTSWDLASLSQRHPEALPDATPSEAVTEAVGFDQLRAVLKACDVSAKALSDALSQRHFSHADRDNRSLLT